MKKILGAILFLLIVSSNKTLAIEPDFAMAKELAVFESYLGTWQAEFPAKPGQPAMTDVSHWQRALNGKALKTTHSINDGMYGGETTFIWDKKQNKIIFYYFTTADFYTQGTVEVNEDGSFVAYEDVSGESETSKGITKVRSTSAIKNNKMVVSTSYLKNGAWTTPEHRTYTKSNRQVVFK